MDGYIYICMYIKICSRICVYIYICTMYYEDVYVRADALAKWVVFGQFGGAYWSFCYYCKLKLWYQFHKGVVLSSKDSAQIWTWDLSQKAFSEGLVNSSARS